MFIIWIVDFLMFLFDMSKENLKGELYMRERERGVGFIFYILFY